MCPMGKRPVNSSTSCAEWFAKFSAGKIEDRGYERRRPIKYPARSRQSWPGLNQFFEDHDRYFRGRDEEAELFRLVKSETLTILFGKSGLGKSSLLKPGFSGSAPGGIPARLYPHSPRGSSDGRTAACLASLLCPARSVHREQSRGA